MVEVEVREQGRLRERVLPDEKGQLSSLCGWVSVIYTVATVDVKTMWFHDTASKANSVQLSLMKGFNTST